MFVLAATGSAVGLGNIWRFPYITAENGGGAFVLVYLVCILLIGVPILAAELSIGRRARRSPVNALRSLARSDSGGRYWWLFGYLGMGAGLLILSFLSVIAGSAMAYMVRTAGGVFEGVTARGAESIFIGLIGDPERLLAWHTLFMAMTTVIVARGVRLGLEWAAKYLVPVFFLLLLLLVLGGYLFHPEAFWQGVGLLFYPEFSALTANGILVAMGHAFFTLSLGMGVMIIYGSYLPAGTHIGKMSLAVAATDTLAALLAGLAVFPWVLGSGLEMGIGPGLVFQTLPVAFGQTPAGSWFGALFFLLLVIAALTSAISLFEPTVAWLVENKSMGRPRAAAWVGGGAWLAGILTVMSLGPWAFDFQFAGELRVKGMFDILDILTSVIMLPAGGLAVALFAGWVLYRSRTLEALGKDGVRFRLGYLVLRYVTPLSLAAIFVHTIGVI